MMYDGRGKRRIYGIFVLFQTDHKGIGDDRHKNRYQ